jgi:hypothetical protein
LPLRTICSTVLIALAICAASASAASERSAGMAPSLVHRGGKTTISIKSNTSVVACTAMLTYANGKGQMTPSRRPVNGRVTFVVSIPKAAAYGPGHWVVHCGLLSWQGSFIVVQTQSKSGTVNASPTVAVDKQGFLQRPDKSGPGSLLSYGLVLHDTSRTEDAQNVYVIVNMVDAAGELLGSQSQTVGYIPAGGTYALGNALPLRTQVGVTQLELTIRVGGHEPHKAQVMPNFANVRLLPSIIDPGWVAEVDGEVVNDTSPKTLSHAQLSIVVLDAGGNVLGGGSGTIFAAVPSGSRFVFVATNGFKAIPLDQAASALISPAPSYESP